MNDLTLDNDTDKPDLELPTFFKFWFAFVAILALAMIVGAGIVIFKILAHFGVLA